MKQRRNVFIGATFVATLAALGVGQQWLEQRAMAQAGSSVQAPRFEVDPMWPKPLPNGWYIGQTIGVWVDNKDHVAPARFRVRNSESPRRRARLSVPDKCVRR